MTIYKLTVWPLEILEQCGVQSKIVSAEFKETKESYVTEGKRLRKSDIDVIQDGNLIGSLSVYFFDKAKENEYTNKMLNIFKSIYEKKIVRMNETLADINKKLGIA